MVQVSGAEVGSGPCGTVCVCTVVPWLSRLKLALGRAAGNVLGQPCTSTRGFWIGCWIDRGSTCIMETYIM